MIIYKIINLKNNKIYIGQTSKSIQERFSRHINDALSNRLNTHLARAIRLYGSDSFIIEQIDEATTQEELNKKEIQWTHFYNSIKEGYNEIDNEIKSGGNTYKYKTPEEMEIIKSKISESKQGNKNPNAKQVKCKNIITNEEHLFNTINEMQQFFQESNHTFISSRCNHRNHCLYKKEWLIAYAKEDYPIDFTIEKDNYKSKKIEITDLNTNETRQFDSFASAERFYNLSPKALSSKAYKYKNQEYFVVKQQYKIKVLE